MTVFRIFSAAIVHLCDNRLRFSNALMGSTVVTLHLLSDSSIYKKKVY